MEVYNALVQGGPVVSGAVTAAHDGLLTFAVKEQLRGPKVATTLSLPYQPQSGGASLKQPPFLWQRVTATTGKHLLLCLSQQDGAWQASGILDLDTAEASALPQVRQMLVLENDAAKKRKEPLLKAVSDSSFAVRGVAIEFLTARVCAEDAVCRGMLLDTIAKVALDATSTQRVWAVGIIGSKVYAGFHKDDAVDAKAAAVLAGLLADPDDAVRGEAVQYLHGLLLGGGTVTPKVQLADAMKDKILTQLHQDAAGTLSFAAQSGDLARLLGR